MLRRKFITRNAHIKKITKISKPQPNFTTKATRKKLAPNQQKEDYKKDESREK